MLLLITLSFRKEKSIASEETRGREGQRDRGTEGEKIPKLLHAAFNEKGRSVLPE